MCCSGGGSVGRAVASDTRDLRFESQHRQSFIYQLSLNRKDKNKRKRALEWSIKKIITICDFLGVRSSVMRAKVTAPRLSVSAF